MQGAYFLHTEAEDGETNYTLPPLYNTSPKGSLFAYVWCLHMLKVRVLHFFCNCVQRGAGLLSVTINQRVFTESGAQRHSRTVEQQLSSLPCDYANPRGPPLSPGEVAPVKELLRLPPGWNRHQVPRPGWGQPSIWPRCYAGPLTMAELSTMKGSQVTLLSDVCAAPHVAGVILVMSLGRDSIHLHSGTT